MSLLLADARQKALSDLESGVERECSGCMTPFVAVKGFERLCPICFKLDRGYDLYVGDKALLRLQEKYRSSQERHAALEGRYKRVRAKAKQLMQAAASGDLTQERITQLIRLCHPDKHGNSRAATDVTQWLLSMRRKG